MSIESTYDQNMSKKMKKIDMSLLCVKKPAKIDSVHKAQSYFGALCCLDIIAKWFTEVECCLRQKCRAAKV